MKSPIKSFAAAVALSLAFVVCASASGPFAKADTATTVGRHQEREIKQITEIPGTIKKWVDGDTCWFISDNTGKEIHVRLWLVDAPELSQPGGEAAKNYMKKHQEIGDKKRVILGMVGTDQYDRALGQFKGEKAKEYCTEELLKSGYFWPYYPALWHDISQDEEKRLKKIFNATKAAKKGIFEDDDAVEPYIWRREHPRTSGAEE